MIRNQWYTVLESNEVPRHTPLSVTRMGERLVFWRNSGGAVTCMHDICPHRRVALSLGRIVGDCLECPFHGFQYDGVGRCRLIPANGKGAPIPQAIRLDTYPTHEAHGLIAIWWGEPRDPMPAPPHFEALDESFSYVTVRDRWATHYSRAIENQLDVVHLPFLHKTTIGRGGRTLVNGPLVRWETHAFERDRLNLWLKNEVDTGQRPLRPEEMLEPNRHPGLQFQFPNLWHNWINDTVRVFAAFAPIDDANTQMYVRFYQSFVRTPVLRDLVNLAAWPFNLLILRQDKATVQTHVPGPSDLRGGEKLIQGDLPIIEFRRRRAELLRGQSAIPEGDTDGPNMAVAGPSTAWLGATPG